MFLERGARIELATLAWKAKVIPFYEPRFDLFNPHPEDWPTAIL
jgi:hypothetical protein